MIRKCLRASWSIAVFSMLSAVASVTNGMEPTILGELNDGSVLMLDLIQGESAVKIVRTRLVFSELIDESGVNNVRSKVDTQTIDCVRRTQETTRIELFSNTTAMGEPLRTFELPLSVRQRVSVNLNDGNTVAAIFTAVCGQSQARIAPLAQTGRPGDIDGLPTVPGLSKSPNFAPLAKTGQSGDIGGLPTVPVVPTPPITESQIFPLDSLANQEPFPAVGSTGFKLGTMGRLAEYIYFDQDRAELLAKALGRMELARHHFATLNETRSPAVIELAYVKVKKAEESYNRMLVGKDRFLESAKLRLICVVKEETPSCLPGIRLPKLAFRVALAGFRAELYEHTESHNSIIVFRGTQGWQDWVSNAWLGVDFLKIEAPHYEAARIVTEQFIKSGLVPKSTLPVVVGHSLGGGMAQYVGYRQKLNVVAFNSSPLPNRYIPKKLDLSSQQIRVFSAVEFSDEAANTIGIPDPVSLFSPNASEVINEFVKYGLYANVDQSFEPIKAHVHLVPPICVKSVPNPFLTPDEDEDIATVINQMYSRSFLDWYHVAFSKDVKKLEKYVIQETVMLALIEPYLNDPFWDAGNGSKINKDVADYTRKAVVSAAFEIRNTTEAAINMGSILYDMAFGNSTKALKNTVKPILSAAKELAFKRVVMAHSMGRFNRGMMANLDSNVFDSQVSSATCLRPTAANKFH